MNSRIDFEDCNYGINLEREGDSYRRPKTRERFAGWCAALEHAEQSKKWKRRMLARRTLIVAAWGVIAGAMALEVWAAVHFAMRYW